jgi:hypothetical protein
MHVMNKCCAFAWCSKKVGDGHHSATYPAQRYGVTREMKQDNPELLVAQECATLLCVGSYGYTS